MTIDYVAISGVLALSDAGVWGPDAGRDGISILRSTNFRADGDISFDNLAIKEIAQKDRIRKLLLPGDILVEKSGGGPKQPVGRFVFFRGSARHHVFGNFIARLRVRPDVCDPRFLFWFLHVGHQRGVTENFQKQTTGIRNLEFKRFLGQKMPLPPLDEQRRIVGLLDRAAEIRRRADAARAKARAIIPALFLDTFGDPATNPKRWPEQTVGSLATKMGDGPFGSNLKTEHYCDDGIRVWRLQNIGIGSVRDEDKAFVSGRHFETIRRHECLPGDVIIGTLGDPNLRAIIQPPTIPRAINKADCVQFRPDLTQVNAEYVMALMNQPGMLSRCSGQIAGQTRARISMGRLREVCIPVPPLALQIAFAEKVKCLEALAHHLDDAATKAEAMAAGLSAEVFG